MFFRQCTGHWGTSDKCADGLQFHTQNQNLRWTFSITPTKMNVPLCEIEQTMRSDIEIRFYMSSAVRPLLHHARTVWRAHRARLIQQCQNYPNVSVTSPLYSTKRSQTARDHRPTLRSILVYSIFPQRTCLWIVRRVGKQMRAIRGYAFLGQQ